MANRGTMVEDPWIQLSHGRTIGKTANILVSAISPLIGNFARSGLVDLLQIQGKDDNALQLCVTLLPPIAIPGSQFPGGVPPTDGTILDATGARSNDDIYLHPPIGGADFAWLPLVAKAEWGIGGVQTSVECDFLYGLVLNVCASWLRISIFKDYSFEGLMIPPNVISLGAFVGPGYPKANNAQRTLNVGSVTIAVAGAPNVPGFPVKGYNASNPPTFTLPVPFTGIHNLFPVPKYAKQASITAVINASGTPTTHGFASILDCVIIFYKDIAALNPKGTYRLTSDNPGPVIVPNGAYYWTIQNNSTVSDIDDCSVIFDLAI